MTATPQDSLMPAAFNEWMRRYIEEPERFEREWKTVGKYITERGSGTTPSYGESSTAYLQGIIVELQGDEPSTA